MVRRCVSRRRGGVRVGEVKALRWREDVDLVAKTITVNLQVRNKETTTPKGRRRRTIPMTATLHEALKRMSVIRDGLVVRNLDGSAKSDDQADKAIGRICRRAGLPVRLFHTAMLSARSAESSSETAQKPMRRGKGVAKTQPPDLKVLKAS